MSERKTMGNPQFFVRSFRSDMHGPDQWCIEQSGKRGWEAIVAVFDDRDEAVMTSAGLNSGELTTADLPPLWLRNHRSRRPALGERLAAVTAAAAEAGIDATEIRGKALSFGFRPNR